MEIEIMMGAFAPRLKEQFRSCGLRPNRQLDRIQNLADAITLLSVHGIATKSQSNAMRDKLMKQIEFLIRNAGE